MTEEYRLIYRGEVVEGQHQAVVKKRLQALLKLDDQRSEMLFSGKAVVVKKAADNKTAARYQEAFKKAGARLRIQSLSAEDDPLGKTVPGPVAPAQAPAPEPPSASSQPSTDPASGALSMLPAGADILAEEERAEQIEKDVDTSHLSVQGAVFTVDEPEETASAPNVDHISLAEPGTPIGQSGNDRVEEVVLELDLDFDLAEVGAVLGVETDEASPNAIDADFDLADPGSDLGEAKASPAPPPPDTSHIELAETDPKKSH